MLLLLYSYLHSLYDCCKVGMNWWWSGDRRINSISVVTPLIWMPTGRPSATRINQVLHLAAKKVAASHPSIHSIAHTHFGIKSSRQNLMRTTGCFSWGLVRDWLFLLLSSTVIKENGQSIQYWTDCPFSFITVLLRSRNNQSLTKP